MEFSKIGKAKWQRRIDTDKFGGNGHCYYVLCVKLPTCMVELAGVGWDDAHKDGGWAIEQIGYTVPLKDGYGTLDGEHYKTAKAAKDAAAMLLIKILMKIGE